jgi:hypothetical protein
VQPLCHTWVRSRYTVAYNTCTTILKPQGCSDSVYSRRNQGQDSICQRATAPRILHLHVRTLVHVKHGLLLIPCANRAYAADMLAGVAMPQRWCVPLTMLQHGSATSICCLQEYLCSSPTARLMAIHGMRATKQTQVSYRSWALYARHGKNSSAQYCCSHKYDVCHYT